MASNHVSFLGNASFSRPGKVQFKLDFSHFPPLGVDSHIEETCGDTCEYRAMLDLDNYQLFELYRTGKLSSQLYWFYSQLRVCRTLRANWNDLESVLYDVHQSNVVKCSKFGDDMDELTNTRSVDELKRSIDEIAHPENYCDGCGSLNSECMCCDDDDICSECCFVDDNKLCDRCRGIHNTETPYCDDEFSDYYPCDEPTDTCDVCGKLFCGDRCYCEDEQQRCVHCGDICCDGECGMWYGTAIPPEP
jgi:hypothetical protein